MSKPVKENLTVISQAESHCGWPTTNTHPNGSAWEVRIIKDKTGKVIHREVRTNTSTPRKVRDV